MRGVNADDLSGGSGGVGERADEMEDGADAEGSADWHDGFHCGVERGRKEEGKAMAAECGGALFGRQGDGNSEGFEDVGRATLTGDTPIAVFGDGGSGGCGDEGGGSGDVEGAAGVGSGAAGVGEDGSLCVGEWNGSGGGTHGVDEAGDLGGVFAAGCERAEEGGDVEVGGFTAEDGVKELGGFGSGESLVAFDDSAEVRLQGH